MKTEPNFLYRDQLAKMSIQERKLKAGNTAFYIVDTEGYISGIYFDKEKAKRGLKRIASHLTYKKNIGKVKRLK